MEELVGFYKMAPLSARVLVLLVELCVNKVRAWFVDNDMISNETLARRSTLSQHIIKIYMYNAYTSIADSKLKRTKNKPPKSFISEKW